MLLDGLRTPLYAIIGFSEMMVRELCGPIDGRHRTWADHIHANGMILSDSIEGMFDLAWLEAGNMGLDEESVDVEEVVQATLREAVPQATQREVTLRWVPSKTKVPHLHCDHGCLRRMLLNILLSAAKFDKPGRVVDIRTDLSVGLSIVIQDTGWGLLMDTLRLILTKALIEQQGGEFTIASNPNDGITVRLSFPLERVIRSGG